MSPNTLSGQTTQKRVLEWRTLFPGSADVPVVGHHRVRHPDCQAHSHNFMELVLIAGGTGLHRSAAGERWLSRGDTIILRPGGWHAYHHCSALEIYNLAFGTELLHRELGWTLEDPALSFLLVSGPLSGEGRGVMHVRLSEPHVERCERHFRDLCARDEDDVHAQRRAHRVGLLLIILGDVIEGTELRDWTTSRTTGLHPAVARAVRLLENDIARPWAIRDIAEQVGLERSYLIRQFKAGTGLPPMTYLARRRAERAASLLIHTRNTVGEVAQAVGWTDPVYFARRFKKAFGLTATEYRRQFAETTH